MAAAKVINDRVKELQARKGLFITQVYALKSGVWLCGQKFTQEYRFKTHLFLQNVLQNLVRSTSKSVMFWCFCYF
jgi:hypothetical protein